MCNLTAPISFIFICLYTDSSLGTIAADLWTALCPTPDTVTNLTDRQALVKQFADLLFFILSFDDLKMMNSNVQNDFSFYRRQLSRQGMGASKELTDRLPVKDELAGVMSFFYADPTPMLNSFIGATMGFLGKVRSDLHAFVCDLGCTWQYMCVFDCDRTTFVGWKN